jgi:ABC-2 type transport system permease protein
MMALQTVSFLSKVQIGLCELSKATAFIKKDMKISVSYKLQFLFQFLQIFFSVTLIYFIGKMLEGAGRGTMLQKYHSSYFSFALVGLAINSYLRTGLVTITNDIRQTMNQGTLEAMFAAPTNYTWLMLCSSLWQFLFETVRVLFYFATAFIVYGMRMPNANLPLAALIVFLTAPTFLMLGMISCSILVVIKRGDPINWVFSSLGALLAGTMFPVSVLPKWLQKIAYCMPLTHALEAMRQCLLAGAGITQILVNVLSLVCFIIFLIPITVYVNKMCMRQAKMKGAFFTH